MERIGLFGGTFNPIHLAHLRAAQEVKEAFSLDTVVFIPAAMPPHKASAEVAGADQRIEMARLAVEGSPGFQVSDAEIRRRGLSYTVDTLRHFKSVFPPDAAVFFIVGLDAFLEIDTWKQYQELFALAPFIVVSRPPGGLKEPSEIRREMLRFLREKVASDYRFAPESSAFLAGDLKPVYPVEITLLDIASTRIRRLIQSGRSIKFLVPEAVEAFINSKRLYL